MLFYYTFTLFHYNKAQAILLAVGFGDIWICDIWVCAQPSLDLESEVQQLQEVKHSQLFPDNCAHNLLSSTASFSEGEKEILAKSLLLFPAPSYCSNKKHCPKSMCLWKYLGLILFLHLWLYKPPYIIPVFTLLSSLPFFFYFVI